MAGALKLVRSDVVYELRGRLVRCYNLSDSLSNLRTWHVQQRHRSRQLLACMDARALRDIGLTYADAEEEANKPFWRD